MWVQTLEGNIINLSLAQGCEYRKDWQKGPTVTATDGQREVSIFQGTEPECRAFIAELLEKLNMPQVLTQGMTDSVDRAIKRMEGSIQHVHDVIYKLRMNTR